jgi:tetratricopeptide (TPR) repeat protein
MALYFSFQTDEALAAYRRAVELAPDSRSMRTHLVFGLAEAGYWKEAATECRRALEIHPDNYSAPQALAGALMDHGRSEEAIVMFQKAIESNRNAVSSHRALGMLCRGTGRHEEAVRAFRAVTQLTPADPAARQMLGLALANAGHPEEAITEFQTALALKPTPVWIYPDLGQLLRAQGRPEEAAAAFRQAVTAQPYAGWQGVAAARLDPGRFAEARAATEALIELYPTGEVHRALRRQIDLCDSLLADEAKLPDILAGKERPTDVPTQRALAEWCLKHKRRTLTAAGFYTSALLTQPSLADDLEAGYRFHAACAAALAGCGVGADSAQLDDRRWAELRRQALGWLTADYDVWAERHRLGKPGDHTVAAQAVRAWQSSGDLGPVRDEQALAKLPPGERRDWETLWAKVAALAARDPVELVRRAREHFGRREWGKAVARYAEAFELAPTDDGELWFEYAGSQLLAGDRLGVADALLPCRPRVHAGPRLGRRPGTPGPAVPGRVAAKPDRVLVAH